jgi:hypothetical protein
MTHLTNRGLHMPIQMHIQYLKIGYHLDVDVRMIMLILVDLC